MGSGKKKKLRNSSVGKKTASIYGNVRTFWYGYYYSNVPYIYARSAVTILPSSARDARHTLHTCTATAAEGRWGRMVWSFAGSDIATSHSGSTPHMDMPRAHDVACCGLLFWARLTLFVCSACSPLSTRYMAECARVKIHKSK